MGETKWVAVSSHRARERLERLTDGLGPSYGRWPKGKHPFGEYYEIPAALTVSIKGVRVLRKPPADLFKRWTSGA